MRIVLPLLLFLVACGTTLVPVYLKPGTPTAQVTQDLAACRIEARNAAPERPRITTAPRITIGVGRCIDNVCIGASQGDVFDYDTNAEARGRVEGTCMGRKGYRLVELPTCRGAAQALESQPFDLRGTCVANGVIAAPL
ncbi:hypothetical protein [Jannaschia aquimarina]|nr:hypothetical protein [Jannaschia aquimarina]